MSATNPSRLIKVSMCVGHLVRRIHWLLISLIPSLGKVDDPTEEPGPKLLQSYPQDTWVSMSSRTLPWSKNGSFALFLESSAPVADL